MAKNSSSSNAPAKSFVGVVAGRLSRRRRTKNLETSEVVDGPAPTIDNLAPTIDDPVPAVDDHAPRIGDPASRIDDPVPTIDEETIKLTIQLNDVREERDKLRTYLQLDDTQDPLYIVELFGKLNVSIKNSCLLASSAVLKSVTLKSSWTTKKAKNIGQLQKDLDGAGALVLSKKGAGRTPGEFLSQAFCFVVNSALVNNLFGRFHPGLPENEDKLLSGIYHEIRRRDPQHLSARWRCLTYSAVDNRIPPSSEWSDSFADDVLKKLSSVVSSLFNSTPSVFPANFRGELISIGTEAYNWNRMVKSTFKSLDFCPVLFTSADPFDPDSMILYLNHKADKTPPRNIVVAVTLGLASSLSVPSGDEMKEEIVWQTKAEVVTEGFF